MIRRTVLALSLFAVAPALAADTQLPNFSLPAIVPGKPGLGSATFRQGQPRVLNIFASWCVPCIGEVKQLQKLQRAGVEVDGVATQDSGPAVYQFLARYGDPYARIGDDRGGAVKAMLGASGVPETYVIDGAGRIVFRQPGDIAAEDLPRILAAVRRAQ